MKLKNYYSDLPWLILLMGLSLFACKKESIIPASPSYNYFPDQRGRWVSYTVDSIYHGENDNNNDDSVYSFRFQVMETIDSTFLDGQGRPTQLVYRYKRQSSADEWSFVAVWTQTLTLTGAYRKEDNIAYHKLAFPINSSINWDGNAANTLEEEFYSYEDIHESLSLSGISFDSTLTVQQMDEDNFVEKIFGKEIYAAGVGLIYRERDELGKRNGIVVKGLEYKMTLLDYGPR